MPKRVQPTLLLLTLLSLQSPAATTAPALERAPDTTYDLAGPLRQHVDLVTANWLRRAPDDNPAILDMFRDRDKQPPRDLLPWSGEFAGKYLTGATQVLRLTGDQKLHARLQKFVADLIACQDADGYLGPFPKTSRLTGKAPNVDKGKGGTWDAWGHYHVMIGLLLWHDQTRDPRALAAARKIGDLLCETFPRGGRTVSSTGSAEMNQAIAHSLALLDGPKYRDLAQRIVDEDFQSPAAGDYLRAALAGKEFFQTRKPRWESLHPIMALAPLYYSTGDAQYRTAFEHLWWSIAKLDRHNNGGFSSGEQAHGDPYHRGPIETCCTIAWMAMSVEMLRMTGDPRVADELELSTLNQVVALHSPDGKWSTYNTPMDGVRVPSTKDISFQIRPGSEQLNCCSVNAARGFGMITDWALMRARDGELILNWYGPSTLTTMLSDHDDPDRVRLTLRQETTYPKDGHIDLHVNPSRPLKFALKLRIPHWSTKTKVSVNGAEIPAVRPGAYLTLDREWRPGDRISIDLDFTPRYWVGERDYANKTSVYRGPLLLAFESPAPTTQPATPSIEPPQLSAADIDRAKPLPTQGRELLFELPDTANRPTRLRDYASSGEAGKRYASWLRITGPKPTEFSPENPSRTHRAD